MKPGQHSAQRMRVFHRTARDAAADIRNMGFYDSTGTYMTATEHTGVWVSDRWAARKSRSATRSSQ
jgi:hypothetical protein